MRSDCTDAILAERILDAFASGATPSSPEYERHVRACDHCAVARARASRVKDAWQVLEASRDGAAARARFFARTEPTHRIAMTPGAVALAVLLLASVAMAGVRMGLSRRSAFGAGCQPGRRDDCAGARGRARRAMAGATTGRHRGAPRPCGSRNCEERAAPCNGRRDTGGSSGGAAVPVVGAAHRRTDLSADARHVEHRGCGDASRGPRGRGAGPRRPHRFRGRKDTRRCSPCKGAAVARPGAS